MKPMLTILFVAIGGIVAMAQTNPPQNHPSGGTAPSTYQAAVPVVPQAYGGGYDGYDGWDGGGGIAAGNAMQGMAAVINAAGNYNLSTSAAAMNMTQAQKQEIQNWASFTNTYFDLRAANRKAWATEQLPSLTEEQLNRITQAGAPKPLPSQQLDPVSGRIAWPNVLLDSRFQVQRETLEAAFTNRVKFSTMPWQDLQKVEAATSAMLDELAGMIRDVEPMDYMPAKRFIQSLAYAARKPAF